MPNHPTPDPVDFDVDQARVQARLVGALDAIEGVFDFLDNGTRGDADEQRDAAVREAISAARLNIHEALRRCERRHI
jgi:hypothetical protein